MPRQPIKAKARARKTHNRIYKVWQSGACDICVNRSTTTLYRRISSISSIRTTVYGTSYKVITTLPCLTVPAEEEKPIGIWGGSGACDISRRSVRHCIRSYWPVEGWMPTLLTSPNKLRNKCSCLQICKTDGCSWGRHRTAQGAKSNDVDTADEIFETG